MKTLEFLRAGGTIKDLEDQYHININVHKTYPNVISLNYDQIDSPVNELTNECRGLLLDIGSPGNPIVISRGYDRFFNYGESRAAIIDWNTAHVYSKVDGSYCSLYWYDNKWHVSTRGTPDASGEVNGWGITFAQLFWRTWKELDYQLPQYKFYNYLFELCTKENKVVCQWKEPHIILHGIRDRESGREFNISTLINQDNKYCGWEAVKTHNLYSFDEIVKACEQLNPIQDEGFVICDAQFNRVKCKSIKYVSLGNLRDGHGPKRIIEIIRNDGMDEFVSYFPEWRDIYQKYTDKYNEIISKLEDAWIEYNYIENQKEFALTIKNIPFNGALFMMRTGKIKSVKDYLRNININNLVEYFK